jgi:RNA polymerase subunit RPABC4/transcription elongation factor Spt4
MATICPVCSGDHPTGRFTQTFGGVRHSSRECAYVASHAGIVPGHLRDPKTLRMLQAGKRYFEKLGLDRQCDGCGAIVGRDAEACTRCGKWQL